MKNDPYTTTLLNTLTMAAIALRVSINRFLKMEQLTTLCLLHYDTLPRKGKPNVLQEWTVAAAILCESTSGGKATVVSFGTGSKCLGHERIEREGLLVVDSHAEIVAKRAFQRYKVVLNSEDF